MSLPVDAPGPTRDHNTKHTLVLYISAFTTITRRWNTFMERRRTKQFEGFHGMILDQRVLDDRYTSIRDIGDGSFGNVCLARRKGSGRYGDLVRHSHDSATPKACFDFDVAADSTAQSRLIWSQVAIKTMKKPIDPPEDCLKLREVQV